MTQQRSWSLFNRVYKNLFRRKLLNVLVRTDIEHQGNLFVSNCIAIVTGIIETISVKRQKRDAITQVLH